MTAESLLSHLTEFGGTDLKHCPALAVKLFNELNNKVEFIYEHGQVTCEEMKLTYLKKMVDHTKFAVVHCNDGLQHTSAASSSPSIILSIYGRNFLPLAYSLHKIRVHLRWDEDGKIIVDVMHWYELKNLKALYDGPVMSLVYRAEYTWIYIKAKMLFLAEPKRDLAPK